MMRRQAVLLAFVPTLAWAQAPTVDPSGRTPPAPAAPLGPGANTGVPGGIYGIDQPPPPPPPPEIRVIVPPGGQVEGASKEPKEPEGLYLGGMRRPGAAVRAVPEAVPETYVVQKGDTLWDICAHYLGDPYLWPKVWAQNSTITNPHWIYPGDVVRLRPAGSGPATAPTSEPTASTQPLPTASEAARLRRVAFVSVEDFQTSAEIVGAAIERIMLSSGDEIYLSYPDGKPPQVGSLYAIYSPTQDVKHPDTGRKIGTYVLLLGEVKILDVKKGKNAHGIITDVTDEGVIERGNRVGTLKTQFQAVATVPPEKSVEGVIVGILHTYLLIGEGQLVVIDRGRRDGLVPGNVMQAVRRGDAYMKNRSQPAGLDDRRYPDKYFGDIIVVDVADGHSMGQVAGTEREILIGDHVVMRAVAK
jgi:LysM domain